MNRVILYFLILVMAASCTKESMETELYSEASYKVTITGKWKMPEFTVPAFVHFTTFTGMVHNDKNIIWKTGTLSSPGIENVAEVGDNAALITEIQGLVINGAALSKITIDPPSATGNVSTTINCNSNYSMVSLISMLAPSPDWFTGVTSLDLYAGKKWVNDIEVNLYCYDAGTEDGDVFAYNNPASVPQQQIQLLTAAKATVLANGNSSLGVIASIRFTKL